MANFKIPWSHKSTWSRWSYPYSSNYWDIIKYLIQPIQTFFSTGEMIIELIQTYIVLITSIDSAIQVSNYRPISLCNTIYKIISKIIASRIKLYLQRMISPYQSPFIKGRLIQENSIVANESLHFIKKSKAKDE